MREREREREKVNVCERDLVYLSERLKGSVCEREREREGSDTKIPFDIYGQTDRQLEREVYI